MKTTSTLLALASGSLFTLAAGCTNNNCARAVTGTNGLPPVSSKKADCSSFFKITVTPAVFTSTVWATVTPFTVTPATITYTVVDSTQIVSVSSHKKPKRARGRICCDGGAVADSVTPHRTPSPPLQSPKYQRISDDKYRAA